MKNGHGIERKSAALATAPRCCSMACPNTFAFHRCRRRLCNCSPLPAVRVDQAGSGHLCATSRNTKSTGVQLVPGAGNVKTVIEVAAVAVIPANLRIKFTTPVKRCPGRHAAQLRKTDSPVRAQERPGASFRWWKSSKTRNRPARCCAQAEAANCP